MKLTLFIFTACLVIVGPMFALLMLGYWVAATAYFAATILPFSWFQSDLVIKFGLDR